MSYRATITVTLTCEPASADQIIQVDCLHCDDCHRWGRLGSTHLCNQNWFASVRELITELLAEED